MSSSSSQQGQPSTSSAAMNMQSLQQSLPHTQQPNPFTFSTEFPSNALEIANLKQLMSQHESIKIIEIKNCPTTLNAYRLISNSLFCLTLECQKNFTTLILKINEQLNEQHAEKPKIHEIKIARNFLISYESQTATNEKIIYWKNGNEGNYLTINLMKGCAAEITDFVRDFLTDNVDMNYDKSINNKFELVNLNDVNNLNLLMKAVESEQKSSLIYELLNLTFDINQESNDGKTAADIACENGDFRILSQLLEANSTYPNNFNIDQLETNEFAEKIKKLLQITKDMHDAIWSNKLKIIKNLIKQKPNLRYFYNSSNLSAAKAALNAKNFKAYEILPDNKCSIGPNENLNDAIDNAYKNDEEYEPKKKKMKSTITDVHDNASKSVPEKHLLILCKNSKICHDDQHDKYRLKVIREAYNYLNKDAVTKQILQLISKHNNFEIYFDFNRSSIEFMNPHGGDQSTPGLYEDYDGIKKASLYIAAKELISNDGDGKFAALGTLAHELCRFAMNLTFYNDAKPYAIDVEKNKLKFDAIIEKCKVIPLEILKCKKKIKRSQKLIALCEKLLQKSPDEVNEITNNYEIKIRENSNIVYKKNKTIEINQEKIASIGAHNLKLKNYIKKCRKKLVQNKKNKFIKKIINRHEEIIELNERTVTTQTNEIEQLNLQIINNEKLLEECKEELQLCKSNDAASIRKYQNEISKQENEIEDIIARSDFEEIVSLVFTNYNEDLWGAELIVRVPHMIAHYQNNPQRLKKLKDETFKDLFDYYNDVVVPKMNETLPKIDKFFNNSTEIKYNDLTDAYKAKIHHSKVNFQGVDVKFNEIIEDIDSEIFQHLSSEHIRKILIENESENDTFIIGRAQEIKTKLYVERDFIDHDIKTKYNKEKVSNNLKTFDDISSIADTTKMILLSDHAGAGKTTTFKHLSVKLKKNFPNYWISYIDLKRHLEVYGKHKDNFHVLEVLKEILSITDKFEDEIFTKLFNCGNVILLYDGVDEIAPKFKDFFINFIKSVRNSTNNQQWIATRPQHMKELRDKFNQRAYKLLPIDKKKKVKLIKNVLENLNVKNVKAEDVLEYINQISFRYKINSPLMLQMMTELYVNDKTILEDTNKYLLYDKMIEMKKDIVSNKGKIVINDCDNPKTTLTIWQVHQIYALKLLFKYGFEDRLSDDKTIDINEFQLLKKWKNQKSNWTPEAISRYGFLTVNHWNTDEEFPDFVHRTFAEFFVAQFAIQDLLKLGDDDEVSEKEIEMRVKLLIAIETKEFEEDEEYEDYDYSVIWYFISCFIDTHEFKKMRKHILKLLTSNEMQKSFFDDLDSKLIKILSIDEGFLKEFKLFQYSINEHFLSTILEIVDIYKKSLGADWINHTGYSLKKNLPEPNNEEIDEILKECSKYEANKNSSKLKNFYNILNIIDQLEIPQNNLLEFFINNFIYIYEETFQSSCLTQYLMKFIQKHFNNYINEFLTMIIEKLIKMCKSDYSYDDKKTTRKLLQELREFVNRDEMICEDDKNVFNVKFHLYFRDMQSIIKSYEENFFTKNQIQQVFIKDSVKITENIEKNKLDLSIEDLISFLNKIFDVQSDKDQLKKFLEMRYENKYVDDDDTRQLKNHTMLSYLDEKIKIYNYLLKECEKEGKIEDFKLYSKKIKRFKLFQKYLLESAKQIGISDDKIEKLSRKEEIVKQQESDSSCE